MSDTGHIEPGNRGQCQDCGDAPATHVCVMTIGEIPVGPLYVCEDCYPEPDTDD